VGEGVIDAVEFLTSKEVFEKYGQKVFLNEDELTYYTIRQPNRDPAKKMLVLVLSKLKKYSQPKKFEKKITMVGQYLNLSDYRKLVE